MHMTSFMCQRCKYEGILVNMRSCDQMLFSDWLKTLAIAASKSPLVFQV